MESRFLFKFDFDHDDLTPFMSKETVTNHLKHLSKYATNLAMLISETKFENKDLDQILQHFEDVNQFAVSDDSLYNNAAQVKNHHLFFEQLQPTKKRQELCENEQLIQMIAESFDGFANLKIKLIKAITRAFGSGWVWVTLEQHRQWDAPKLAIRFTPNGGTFITSPRDPHYIAPLFAIDMWEHAYYLDSQGDREHYFNNLWRIIDWGVVDTRFEQAVQTLMDYTKPFEH